MFKMIDVIQGDDDWFQARLGKITASVFSDVVTKTGKRSKSSETVVNKAVAELITGEIAETFQSDAMLRGNEIENEALRFFNFTFNHNFQECGFMSGHSDEFGCSPDGVDLKNKIGLELKGPFPHTHLAYLAGGVLPPVYFQQVQFSLLVSGFDKWIFGSYHPQFPALEIVVERNDTFLTLAEPILSEVCEEIRHKTEKIRTLIEQMG